jgi:hypothetical protein
MSDHGRMTRRLATSYREDDRRRADDRRRRQAVIDRPSTAPAAEHAPRLGFPTILRHIPWFA